MLLMADQAVVWSIGGRAAVAVTGRPGQMEKGTHIARRDMSAPK